MAFLKCRPKRKDDTVLFIGSSQYGSDVGWEYIKTLYPNIDFTEDITSFKYMWFKDQNNVITMYLSNHPLYITGQKYGVTVCAYIGDYYWVRISAQGNVNRQLHEASNELTVLNSYAKYGKEPTAKYGQKSNTVGAIYWVNQTKYPFIE